MLSLKKTLFSFKNNAILHNRVILYFIFLLSLGNLFYLSVERDFTSISVFLLVGFLTSFFSKNMLIIMFVALITSAILKHGSNLRHEGLENMDENADGDVVDEDVVDEDVVEDVVDEDIAATGEDANVQGQDEDNDLSNENYLEEEDTTMPKKVSKKAPKKTVAEEEVVENYEDGEDEYDEDEMVGEEEEDIFEKEGKYIDSVEPFSGWR